MCLWYIGASINASPPLKSLLFHQTLLLWCPKKEKRAFTGSSTSNCTSGHWVTFVQRMQRFLNLHHQETICAQIEETASLIWCLWCWWMRRFTEKLDFIYRKKTAVSSFNFMLCALPNKTISSTMLINFYIQIFTSSVKLWGLKASRCSVTPMFLPLDVRVDDQSDYCWQMSHRRKTSAVPALSCGWVLTTFSTRWSHVGHMLHQNL